MILSRTPLRISLVGGGTDMPAFYKKNLGCVVSFAINKFVHIAVNEKFDGRTRLSYSVTEDVAHPAELNHDIARQTLLWLGIKGVEISSLSDIPGSGTGLGSSSAFSVGLIAALTALRNGEPMSKYMLARESFNVEQNLCGHPIGKQDQYAAAYGGFHNFIFRPDDTVCIEPVFLSPENKTYLESHMMLFYTGVTRAANAILFEQQKSFSSEKGGKLGVKMLDLAMALRAEVNQGHFGGIGAYLFEGWEIKRKFTKAISNPEIDESYRKALSAGADGGKICGAGGGGFLLLWAKPDKQEKVREAVGLRQVSFKIESSGSTIVYGGNNG